METQAPEAKKSQEVKAPKKPKRQPKVRLNAVQQAVELLRDGNILHDPKKVKSVYILDSKDRKRVLMRVQTPTSLALFKLCKVVDKTDEHINYALKA